MPLYTPGVVTLTGTANQVTVSSPTGAVTLSLPSAVTIGTLTLTNALTGANGGTGLSAAAIGDLIYASATTPTWARLADVAVNQVLTSGGVSAAPAWSATPTLTSLTAATMIGGTAAGSSLVLQSTSGVGTTDFIRFLVGNNGAREAGRFLTDGSFGVGTTTPNYENPGNTNRPAITIVGVQFGKVEVASSQADGTNDEVGRMTFTLVNNTAANSRGVAFLDSFASGTTANHRGADFRFWTKPDGGTLVQRMTIDPTGLVSIGPSVSPGAQLDIAVGANTTGLKMAGYSLTGSSALSMVSLAGTLNTSGAPTVWDLNITQTASGAATLLMAARDGATNYMTLSKAGALTLASTVTIGSTLALSLSGANNRAQLGPGTVPGKVGIASASVAAAAAEDGGVMVATVDNTLIYYSSGNRYKVVGVSF